MLNITERPKKFSEMVGQDIALKELKNRSKTVDFPTYSLFSGLSGSGKSTSAYITAKLLQCKTPVKNDEGYFDACDECVSCKDINEGKFRRDVQYIDASNLNKEEVLKLGKSLSAKPMWDKNKIIIIDESHLIASGQAKSAFLTMTEKERPNTYIFLATTEEKKFDTAFRRRFRKFEFKDVLPADIATYLFSVLDSKDLVDKVPDEFLMEGLNLIGEASSGSPGIAIGILEDCLYAEMYSPEDIKKQYAVISKSEEFDIITGLLSKDSQALYKIQTVDLETFYNRSKKILTDASIYDITGNTDAWKEKNAKLLKQYDKLSLLECYAGVYGKGYFDGTEFMFNLVKYFKGNNTLHRLEENVKEAQPEKYESHKPIVSTRVRTRKK